MGVVYICHIVICVNLTLRYIHLYLFFSIGVFIIKLICNLLLFPVYLNFLLISFTVFAYLNFILILLIYFLCSLLEYSLLTCLIFSGFVPSGFTDSKNKFNSIQFSSIPHKLKKKIYSNTLQSWKEFVTANATELSYLNTVLLPATSNRNNGSNAQHADGSIILCLLCETLTLIRISEYVCV